MAVPSPESRAAPSWARVAPAVGIFALTGFLLWWVSALRGLPYGPDMGLPTPLAAIGGLAVRAGVSVDPATQAATLKGA